jgi:hypothetical protein
VALDTRAVCLINHENATPTSLGADHRAPTPDAPDEVPPDVLRGFAGFAGVLRRHYPERIPAYRERVNGMLDELPRLGKAHEAPRFALFLALLGDGGGATK